MKIYSIYCRTEIRFSAISFDDDNELLGMVTLYRIEESIALQVLSTKLYHPPVLDFSSIYRVNVFLSYVVKGKKNMEWC